VCSFKRYRTPIDTKKHLLKFRKEMLLEGYSSSLSYLFEASFLMHNCIKNWLVDSYLLKKDGMIKAARKEL